MLSIHPDRINFYTTLQRFAPKKSHRFDKIKMPDSNAHGNKVSQQARRRISKAIDYLIFLSTDKKLPATTHGKALNFKISFVTLTLSSTQTHSDNEIKEKCLNQFFVEARKKWHVKNYLWRAEKQINGNIHFHILTDRFIPWSELRDVWNRIQNKLGYVDVYRQQMLDFHSGGFKVRDQLLKKWSYKNQLKAYKEGSRSDWHNPNSTDIHSLRFVNNCKAYVLKYAAKDEKNGNLQGRLWGCNFELSNIPGGVLIVDSGVSSEMDSLVKAIQPEAYYGEHFCVFSITVNDLIKHGSKLCLAAFQGFLYEHFNFRWQYEIADLS